MVRLVGSLLASFCARPLTEFACRHASAGSARSDSDGQLGAGAHRTQETRSSPAGVLRVSRANSFLLPSPGLLWLSLRLSLARWLHCWRGAEGPRQLLVAAWQQQQREVGVSTQ